MFLFLFLVGSLGSTDSQIIEGPAPLPEKQPKPHINAAGGCG